MTTISDAANSSRKHILNTREDMKKLVEEMLAELRKAVNASVNLKLIEMLQARAATSEEAICEYHERKEAGDNFPPIDLVITPEKLELICFNGYHRMMATDRMGETHIDAKIILGTREEAEILAAGANSAGVVPRTNEDKRSAARLLLSRSERACWSNNRLAAFAKVSPQVVEAVRVDMEKQSESTTYSV